MVIYQDGNWSFGRAKGGTPYPGGANSETDGRGSITRWATFAIREN